MERLKQSHGVEVQWKSYMLRPPGAPPMPSEVRARIEAGRPQFEAMALERYGLRINRGPMGIDSRPALIGEKYAESVGKGEAFHEAGYRAYWQEARNIGDMAVLREIAVEVGLDGDAFEAALQDPRYAREMMQDIMEAQQFGLQGVPALIFQGKYLVSGAQPYEVLVQVVEQVQGQA